MSDPLADLRRELVAAAHRQALARAHTRSHSRWRASLFAGRRRLAGAAVIVVFVLSVSTVGASVWLGASVRPGPLVLGGPKPGSVVLSQLRVPDPAGGIPWGIRVYMPRRGPSAGADCVQIGHVLEGRLGVVGADGAFADDRLFHGLPVEPTVACVHEASFVAYPGLVPASGFIGPGSCMPPAGTLNGGPFWDGSERSTDRSPRPRGRSGSACTPVELRLLVYGVAPVGARAASLIAQSGVLTEPVHNGSDRVFLFVLPARDALRPPREPRVVFRSS
jgi:hypothetical protein